MTKWERTAETLYQNELEHRKEWRWLWLWEVPRTIVYCGATAWLCWQMYVNNLPHTATFALLLMILLK